MHEPTYILKNETTGLYGERIILYYFTCENKDNVHKPFGVGIDMYTQDYGKRTTKERKIIDAVFSNKRDAENFLNIICKCTVTPTSLSDVVDDHISRPSEEKNII